MREGWINVNGADLWAADSEAGYPLLLTPGGPGACDYLGPVSALIEDAVRVIRWEPRGCGQSSQEGPFDLMTTLADMDEIRESFGFERWIVGGHSHGAFLALAYALEYPQRVDGIVYLAGIGIQNDRTWHAAYSNARDTVGEPEPEFAFPHNMTVNREGVDSARAYCRDPHLLQRLATLDVPMIAVAGGQDIRPSWPAEQLAHLMPNAGFVLLPEAPHYLWLTHAEQLGAVVRGFLQSVIPDDVRP
jgi:proline iminopeptidase